MFKHEKTTKKCTVLNYPTYEETLIKAKAEVSHLSAGVAAARFRSCSILIQLANTFFGRFKNHQSVYICYPVIRKNCSGGTGTLLCSA